MERTGMAVNPAIRIMVVDDYTPMRTLIVQSLKALKFNNVDQAENGLTALEKLRTGRYDLVISDWTMPEMDGVELVRAIRADEHLKSLPFLMVTAMASPDGLRQAIEAGITNYVVKPIRVKTLLEKIEKIFSR
jgi:two-component system, chemotaxis family, chemotaxis protein CheY